MVSILDYIGKTINNANPGFQSYRSNGIQLPDGTVIEFTDQKEKEFIGIGDNFGEAFYIRFDPQINFNTSERRITSSSSTISAVKQCRLVAYSWKPDTNSETLTHKLINDLKLIRFSQFSFTQRPVITIKRSNHNYLDNVKEEFKKAPEEVGGFEFVCVSIDFDLKYFPSECECYEETLINCAYE